MTSIVEQRTVVMEEKKILADMEKMLKLAVIGRLYYAYSYDGTMAEVGELKSIDIKSDLPFKFIGSVGGSYKIIKPYVPIKDV